MASPERHIGNNPEQQPSSYSQIPDLVRSSILAKPDRARRAQRQLLQLVENSQYFDPVVIAAPLIQDIALQQQQSPRVIKDSMRLLNEIILQGTGQSDPVNVRDKINVRIMPDTLAATQSLVKNDSLVKKGRFMASLLPPSYEYLMEVASNIQESAKQGKNLITVVHVERPKDGSSLSLEQFNSWSKQVRELLLKMLETPKKEASSRIADDLIDVLKQEPEQVLPGRQKLYTRKYGEISFEDIERMQYPLSKKDFDKITDFLLLAFSDKLSLHEEDISVIHVILNHQTLFNDLAGLIPIRNKNILAIINSWQENFVDQLLFGEDEMINAQIKDVLRKKAVSISPIMWGIPHHFRGNPNVPQIGLTVLDKYLNHPITYRYLKAFLEERYSNGIVAKYIDELGMEWLEAVAIPRLKERLTEFCLIEELENEIMFLEETLQERPYSKTHLEAIKLAFEINAGAYFLEKLNGHTEEMEDITKEVWEEIYQQGVHFLPLSRGSETIEFSSDSLPNLLGLKSVEFSMPDLQRGEVSVKFNLLNMNFILLSSLDLNERENSLSFKAPLREDSPGLYTILNLITSLAMRDLVTQEVQEINKEESTDGNPPVRKGAWQEFLKWLKNLSSKKLEKTTVRILPRERTLRTQKDQDVISAIHKDFPQRRVSIHRRALAGAQDYWSAAGEYINALGKNEKEDRVQILEKEIESARKRLHRISSEKRVNLPPRFQLGITEDPITGEKLYLETWVVEHTSPKPTEEELSSPLQLFRRYYKNSSALAFLDQLKPWFVGQ